MLQYSQLVVLLITPSTKHTIANDVHGQSQRLSFETTKENQPDAPNTRPSMIGGDLSYINYLEAVFFPWDTTVLGTMQKYNCTFVVLPLLC